jgi:hypothetical protein
LDFDNDGQMDLLFTGLADRPLLLRNRNANGHHWLTLQLEGVRSNRSGYGARLQLSLGNRTLSAQALCPTGFLSQGDPRPHFGLAKAATVDKLEILWPSGTRQVLTGVAPDQVLKIKEPSP